MSTLSDDIERTSSLLKLGAASQVSDYERRFSSLRNLHGDLFSNLIRMHFDRKEAYVSAEEFFGDSTVHFAAVDGTTYSRPLFDMMIFFGGAYASTGTVTFRENENPTVVYDRKTMNQKAGLSTVVPIYVNEIVDIDQAFYGDEPSEEVASNKQLTDESIADNATIADWIMNFSEHYLAYKLATNPQENIRLMLLDRSLSIERASLLYDTSRHDFWKTKSNIRGYEIDGVPIDDNELIIARQCVCNKALELPPSRGDYLVHAITYLAEQNESLTEKQILSELGIADDRRTRRVERAIRNLSNRGILCEKEEKYVLNPRYAMTRERIKKLVTCLGDAFFFNKTSHPMKVVKNGKEHWLTTLDIAFLTLFSLHMLMEECWRKHILLVGITKDTAARDFKRQLIPIMQSKGLLKEHITQEEFTALPNTDRMILQSMSMFNPDEIVPP